MNAPTESEQLRFLDQFQRVLATGRFSASYKFALLRALGDLAVERGRDNGAPLPLHARDIADKFIDYYWRQAAPYGTADRVSDVALHQTRDADKNAAILSRIVGARREHGESLARFRSMSERYESLRAGVADTIAREPLWKLQRVDGDDVDDFLYPQLGKGREIELRGTAVACLRRFRGFIDELVEAAWVRFVREAGPNRALLGEHADLHEYLFGSERNELARIREPLLALQHGACFYCDRAMHPGTAQVDHFIPWTRYPTDLGHNLVLAHPTCNESKSNLLAWEPHLDRWCRRNTTPEISVVLDNALMTHHIDKTRGIAEWAYAAAERRGEYAWTGAGPRRGPSGRLRPIGSNWRRLLTTGA